MVYIPCWQADDDDSINNPSDDWLALSDFDQKDEEEGDDGEFLEEAD